MHVAVVTTSYPDTQSGSEAAGGFVADFAESLAQHVRVTVVAATAAATSNRVEKSVNVRRFSVRQWPLSLLKAYNPAHWYSIYKTLRDGARILQDIADSDRPDYILALWALPSGHWARQIHRTHEIPYGIWALGSDIWSLGRVPILRSYLGTVLEDAEQRFADGLQLASDVEDLSGLTCRFLPSARRLPVTSARPTADSAPYRLAYLGRWHPNKGIDLFLDALKLLPRDQFDRVSSIRVHGGGPLEADVRQRVKHLQQVGCPISLGGYLDKVGAVDLIEWSDYMVLPSRIESVPVLLSDAAQLQRPVIATPVGDLPELFERKEFGILAAAPEAQAIADALVEALRTPASQFQPQLAALTAELDIALAAKQFAQHLQGSPP